MQFMSTALTAHRRIPVQHVILLLVVDNAIWASGVLSCARVQSGMKGGVFLEGCLELARRTPVMECAGLRTWSAEWRFVFARLVSPVTCGGSQGFSVQCLASNLFEKSTRSFLSLSVLWEFLGLTQLAWSRRHTTWANSIRCD